MNKIGKVVIFGGTHGNEMSGVFLVNKWMRNEETLKERLSSCPVRLHIANPEAVKLCRRYKDCDLNRQFSEKNYNLAKGGSDSLMYEIKRANELHEMILNTPVNEKPQIILDLHNTTSNMGCTFIVSSTADIFTLHMAAYAQIKIREEGFKCEILTLENMNYASTRNLSEFGLGIEVGPQPQGVLRADILKIQENAVFYCLDFIDKFNKGQKFSVTSVSTFGLVHRVGFPGLSSEVMIHENVQDKDYQELSHHELVFRTSSDKILSLKDVVNTEVLSNPVYPVFVNEAAYYEKDLAFWLASLKSVMLASLEVKI